MIKELIEEDGAASAPLPFAGLPGQKAGPARNAGSAKGSHALERLEELIHRVDELPDPAARELAQDCLHSVLELYGEGLERVLQLVSNAGEHGQPVREALLHDKLVRSLLLIHGIHPQSLEARVIEALDKVRPYLKSHGGNVELVSLEDDVARIRFNGACQSCPSSAVTMELALRRAVEEACPDLIGLELVDAKKDDYVPGHSR